MKFHGIASVCEFATIEMLQEHCVKRDVARQAYYLCRQVALVIHPVWVTSVAVYTEIGALMD